MPFCTIDELMQHLRDNKIDISNETQKRRLINIGYFHGYKGYRFFKKSNNKIPFTNFDDIYATVIYDSKLKALFYEKIMFIETAVKNIALQRIIIDANSEKLDDMYKEVVRRYTNLPETANLTERKQAQANKLKLQSKILSALTYAYSQNNPQITHFYNKKGTNDVPLWAVFEILTLGDFAYLLSCLSFETRDHITEDLNMKVSSVDTNRELIYKYLYLLKDLRNAIAHNSVVFDTRFKKFDPSPAMKKCLESVFGINAVNFKTIEDYLTLVCYYLHLLYEPVEEISSFISKFESITFLYKSSVNEDVANMVIHPAFEQRMGILKKFFK